MRIGSVVFDVNDFEKESTFWREALGYTSREPPSDGWVVLRDPKGKSPNVSMNRADKPLAHKIRIHLDFYTVDQEGEIERLVKLGATVVRRPTRGHDYVIMSDPEGNHFCVVDTSGR
jgi:predicted enzyme related to lactoylglutathione lyase